MANVEGSAVLHMVQNEQQLESPSTLQKLLDTINSPRYEDVTAEVTSRGSGDQIHTGIYIECCAATAGASISKAIRIIRSLADDLSPK